MAPRPSKLRTATSGDSDFDLLLRFISQIAGIAAVTARGLQDASSCHAVWAIEDLAEEAQLAANRYREGMEAEVAR